MRSRGAEVTDIAILVVAADDGVMPQTVEAINHARAAEVPIVVAVTKVDREDADPTRVRQQLTEQELVPEEWGGDTIVLDVAAPTGKGVDELLDSLLLVADAEIAEDLVANPKPPRQGRTCSSRTSTRAAARSSTALVEEGTLRVGDTIVAGPAWGRVRAMFDEHGEAGRPKPVRRCRSRCSVSTTCRSRATSCASRRPTRSRARSPRRVRTAARSRRSATR